MRHLPVILIYFRLLSGLIILLVSLAQPAIPSAVILTLFTAGLLSDIFDGIIARRLQVSTEKLRRLDSTADQVFWICVAIGVLYATPAFFSENKLRLFILLGSEALAYIICYLRFRKEVATHAISSKLWTLVLFATIAELMVRHDSGILFEVCFYLGIATRLEIIAILLLLKQWTNDVPSVFHAYRLRKGKPISRHKLFNG
ncbi:MAG TPA: CDP-alcohol phosphatidyltransferase family protein [Chitinophagaceae bacterium]